MVIPFIFSLLIIPFFKNHLKNKYLRESFGMMFRPMKKRYPFYYMYHWTFMGRRLVVVFALLQYTDNANMALNCIIYSSAFILGWHALFRPFKDKFANFICMINEMFIIGVCAICTLFVSSSYPENWANNWGKKSDSLFYRQYH